ncbi:hypothetical protein B0H13DRAFT_1865047 [Mycena leptocephala]|nr:hypothetical protein B0H13DRAFT_1865047 [Mycena leptocephala]
MLMDRITLEREEGHCDCHTNNDSIYTGSYANDTTTCIYIFHTRTDDAPLTQLGEIRSWIRDGQRRVAFIVGNFYNELVCSKIVSETEDIQTFTTYPAALAFQNDVWRLIWQYLPSASRWEPDRRPRTVAEIVRENSDKLTITFLTDMPECTRNTIIVGTIGLGVSWPISAEKGFQLKFNNIREQGPPLRMKTHNSNSGLILSLNINQSFVNLEKVE